MEYHYTKYHYKKYHYRPFYHSIRTNAPGRTWNQESDNRRFYSVTYEGEHNYIVKKECISATLPTSQFHNSFLHPTQTSHFRSSPDP